MKIVIITLICIVVFVGGALLLRHAMKNGDDSALSFLTLVLGGLGCCGSLACLVPVIGMIL